MGTIQPLSQPPLNILSFGAGAVGTYVGGSLALHGNRVVFLEQPEVAAKLRQSGLRLELEDGEHKLPDPLVAGSLDEALSSGPFDAAIFALKAYDTQPFVENLFVDGIAARVPPILCLQNGVDNEAVLASALGADRVLAGSVTSAVSRRAAGDIVLERGRGIAIGQDGPLASRLAQALNEAGIPTRLYPSCPALKWSKMLANMLSAGQSAILGMTPAEIYARPALYKLEMAQQREGLAVMKALGLKPINLPSAPAALISLVVRLPLWLTRPFVAQVVGKMRGHKMPAFYLDLRAGRKQNEIAFLNGAVVRYGEKTGVPTPINRFITDTVLAMAAGKIPVDAYDHQPDKLIRDIEKIK